MVTRKTARFSKPAKPSKSASRRFGKAKVLSSKLAFQGRNFRVYTDTIVEPGGHRNVRDVVRHHGSVVILAADDAADPNILLVRQYRHAAGQFLLELPAGHRDPGEAALSAARRELAEETGYSARRWKRLAHYYASPGFLGEAMTLYLAEGLTLGSAAPEEDENLQLERVPLSRLLKMVKAGKILDGKTIIGVLLFASKF